MSIDFDWRPFLEIEHFLLNKHITSIMNSDFPTDLWLQSLIYGHTQTSEKKKKKKKKGSFWKALGSVGNFARP